jgi:glycosyltransferase involved in cell wall biosynthesis
MLIDKHPNIVEDVPTKPALESVSAGVRMENQEAGITLLAEAAGGVMRHVIDLYKGLRARNWRVRMVLSPLRIEPRYRDELSLLDPRDISYVPMRRSPHVSDFKAYSQIADILKDTPGDTILHAHSTKAGIIGSLLRSRVRASVLTPHAYRGVDPTSSQIFKAFLHVAERAYSKDYDRVLAVAPAEMEYARAIGIKEESLRCIPNGLDTSQIRFAEVFQRRQRRTGRLCLGFVGRLVYQKNPILFLEVLAEVVRRKYDARAIIVGSGPMKDEMLQVAQQLGIANRIDWRGDTPATRCLREMDVMVHTSFYEALPYALIEACADLLPIVATSNYGSEAILRSRLPRNIAASTKASDVASTLLAIIESDSLRLEQSSLMARIAQEYSTENMVTKIEAEYCAVINQTSRAPIQARLRPHGTPDTIGQISGYLHQYLSSGESQNPR